MAIKIVDHKKLEMTEDEWNLYTTICKSYDRPNFKGESLFGDLFETDDSGVIIFLKPPSQRYVSWEVFMFLMALQSHQHLRVMRADVDKSIIEGRAAIAQAIKDLKA